MTRAKVDTAAQTETKRHGLDMQGRIATKVESLRENLAKLSAETAKALGEVNEATKVRTVAWDTWYRSRAGASPAAYHEGRARWQLASNMSDASLALLSARRKEELEAAHALIFVLSEQAQRGAARVEARRRGLDMRQVYEFIDGSLCHAIGWTEPCSRCADIGNPGCIACGFTKKRRNRVFVPAATWGQHGPGTRSQRRYGDFLTLRDAHQELTFREYLRHFAGKDGRP